MPTKLIRKQFLLTDEENSRLETEAEAKGLSVSNLTRIKHGLVPLEVGRKSERKNAPRRKSRVIQPKKV
jgi:hypothetical protein